MPFLRDILGALRRSAPGRYYPMTPEQRGVALLLANLTPQQRRQYMRDRHFNVVGGVSGTHYRLWHCFQQNVEELDQDGRRRWIWCFHPRETLVVGDVLLAQKTALELFEPEAIRIAHCYSNFSANTGPMSRIAREDFARTIPASWRRRLARALHSSYQVVTPTRAKFYRVASLCIIAVTFSYILTLIVHGAAIFH
jgi:hypothetical protein